MMLIMLGACALFAQSVESSQGKKTNMTTEPEQIIKLCDLEPVFSMNERNDLFLREYEKRKTTRKEYQDSDFCALHAYVKNPELSISPACTPSAPLPDSPDSAKPKGIVSASYFFKSQRFFCTASLIDTNGKIMPPRYLDEATFDILYILFKKQALVEQEEEKTDQQKQLNRQYLEQKLQALARDRQKAYIVTIHTTKKSHDMAT